MPTLNKDNGQTGTKVNKEDNNFDLDLFKRAINGVENSGDMDYSQTNKNSNAVGPYQIIYGGVHKQNLKNMFDIESKEEFMNSPQVQEDYMDWLVTKSYPRMLKSLKEQYGPGGSNLENNAVGDFSDSGLLGDFSDYDLMAMEHFLGHEGTRQFFAHVREGREDQYEVPGKVNMGVREYLDKFKSFYEDSDDEGLPDGVRADDSEPEERPIEKPMKFIDNDDNPMDDLGKTEKK